MVAILLLEVFLVESTSLPLGAEGREGPSIFQLLSQFIYSTIAGTVVGLLLEFFAEIDLHGQCRARDVSVWQAQDAPSPDLFYDWPVGI